MGLFSKSARIGALASTVVLAVSPVVASASEAAQAKRTVPITLPLSYNGPRASAWAPGDDTVYDRRWRRYRHHDGIDGGDVLGGVLILGGIAAVAAAIDKDRQDRNGDRTQGRSYPYRDAPYDYRERGAADDQRDYGRGDDGRGDDGRSSADPREADRAVEACNSEAARTGRVDEIYDVDKIDGEWRVKGDFANGREFTCTVDANGRAYIGFDRGAANELRDDSGEEDEPVAVVQSPAMSEDEDDRYATGTSPDFEDARTR